MSEQLLSGYKIRWRVPNPQARRLMEKSKEIVLKTKVTGKLLGIMGLPVLSSCFLLHFAQDAWSKFGPQDPMRYPFAGVPGFIALFILLTTFGVCFHYLGRTVTITKDQIVYRDSKIIMALDIAEMAYSPPAENSLMRTIMFSDGKTFVQVPALFLGDREFDKLNLYIKRSRSKANENSQKTYSL